MFLFCAWHPKYFGQRLFMGEKYPLDNHKQADGICQDCLVILLKEIEDGHPRRQEIKNEQHNSQSSSQDSKV